MVSMETVSVIGLGYIGLPTAAMFASHGKRVIGVDVDEKAVEIINQGKIHIVEPGLEEIVQGVVKQGMMRATTTPEPADAFLMAVPTPFKDGNEPDLRFIEAASKALAPVLEKGNLVVLESTSPVGATEQMSAWLAEARPDLSFPQDAGEDADIRIAHCPERVLPGKVIEELVSNDRIIGGLSSACSKAATELYKIFVEGECITTTAATAEMTKLTENSFRDVNIAFANELSLICDSLGINVWEMISLANRHPRVNILQPGPGVGGHCIAVDPWFIVNSCPEHAKLIRMAREVNDDKPEWVIRKVNEMVGKLLQAQPNKTAKDITVACFGLAFKANIDDLRESPALNIVSKLARQHAGMVLAVEPNIDALPEALGDTGVVLTNFEAAIDQADVLLLLVDHIEFKGWQPQLTEIQQLIDTRGIWS